MTGSPLPLTLPGWEQALDREGPGGRLLGITGHLQLSAAEERHTIAHLRALFTRLLGSERTRVCCLTGLAPGVDQLFVRTLRDWTAAYGVPLRLTGLQPLPVDWMLHDWRQRLCDLGLPPSLAECEWQRSALRQVIEDCDSVVDLMPDGGTAAADDGAFRHRQYRRLAACLVQRVDTLVAVLRDQNLLLPGGTAEVVAWRRNPRLIPAEWCAVAAGWAGSRRLIVIDPAVEYTEFAENVNSNTAGSGTGGTMP